MLKYNFRKIEKKWQAVWKRNKYKVWRAADFSKNQNPKAKSYVLDMFPYPSGEGLHVGHVEGYTASDIYARFLRMNGRNVVHPMGWDAFGLPAENYAIKTKTHPSLVVKKNVRRFKAQLDSLGFSYDWQREINTTDPGYYKWTQWIFLQMFKNGLAYEAEMPVNWCPSCKTVLANEEVIDGHCERCDSLAERKSLKQWILKITDYAERLLKDLDGLDWPERVKEMQRNWIGRSEGVIIKFQVSSLKFPIEVFTTRPDTLAGATYLVLAPEHPLIKDLQRKIRNPNEVTRYVEQASHKSERERLAEVKEKTGVELKGIKAVNPLTNEQIPIWVADYVLVHYGTGAIMAVPAHDQRDFEFAQKFELPIKIVICPNYPEPVCPILEKAYEGDGYLVGSGEFDGLPNNEAKKTILESLIKKDLAKKTVNYKLRDWVFSRQRYWGEPIPLVFCKNCKKQVENFKSQNQNYSFDKFSLGELLNPGWTVIPDSELPVKLPNVKNYQPTGKAESPLAGIEKWTKTSCPRCGGLATRETNTMPQWAGSNWYYLRYLDPKNKEELVDHDKEKYWMGVDLYIGGVEHAVLHLLYARFWHKFLYDIGIVSTKEPFGKLINQGLILGPDGQKMSKSRGNVANPDEIVSKFGADSLRLYEMFMGPLEEAKPWDSRGIVGMHRFLQRTWKLFTKPGIEKNPRKSASTDAESASIRVAKLLHKTIKKVTEDVKNFRFNTAISALMILVNEMEKNPQLLITNYQLLIKLLFPFAPHLAQELWQKLGNKSLLDYEPWPVWDEKLIQEEEFELIIQINGKMRGKIMTQKGIVEEDAKKLAFSQNVIKKWIGGKKIKKTIFVKDRLINFIV